MTGPSATAASVLRLLGLHLSTINARSVLRASLASLELDEASLTERHVAVVLPALERGLRLFIPEDGPRRALIARIAELGGRPAPIDTVRVELATENDVSRARLAARGMCIAAAAPSLAAQKIATAVSELSRNIVRYAGTGAIVLGVIEEPRRTFVVDASDRGPGIPNLDEILAGRYKSKTGMGLGIVGTRRLCDEFDVATGTGGTKIRAAVFL